MVQRLQRGGVGSPSRSLRLKIVTLPSPAATGASSDRLLAPQARLLAELLMRLLGPQKWLLAELLIRLLGPQPALRKNSLTASRTGVLPSTLTRTKPSNAGAGRVIIWVKWSGPKRCITAQGAWSGRVAVGAP